jgi:hypothetical protein
MATLFGRLDLAAQAVQERVFGEAFTLRPRKRAAEVNAAWQPDLDRIEIGLVGIYRERDADMNVTDAWDQRTDRRPGLSAHTHVIEIDPRTNVGFVSQTGDLLLRQDDGSLWRVVSIDPDTMGRLLHNVERAN